MSDTSQTWRNARCHCGAVEVALILSAPPSAGVRCDCSFCSRRGAVMGSVRENELKVLKGAENLTLYSFNTHTAKHYFCKTCGIYMYHRRRSNPHEFGVNLATLDGVNIRDLGEIAWVDGINHPSDSA